MDWTSRKCVPCEGGTPRLEPARSRELLATLDAAWTLEGDRLRRKLRFADFAAALRFVNEVGALAEAEGHHPDLSLHDWNQVDVSLWTHAIGGLSENDFIVAGKIDALPAGAR